MRHLSRSLMQLNLATHASHAGVDEAWLELTSERVTRGQYVDRLSRVFGFEGPVEGVLAYTPQLNDGLDLDIRRRARAGFIALDLIELEVTPAQLSMIPQCPDVAPFTTAAEALGWLYALERSALLHDLVRHHLLARMPELESAVSYLSAFRGAAAERWAELGEAIDAVAISPAIFDTIATAATMAFDLAERWYRPAHGGFIATRFGANARLG